jgi:putative addiction module component (TIGR02574 family)
MNTQLSDILQLSVAERLQLVEDIWDSIATTSDNLPLTAAQEEELDRRIAAYEQNPAEGLPWDEFKQTLGKKQ